MSILSDNQIAQLCRPFAFMIEGSCGRPFLPDNENESTKFFPANISEEEIKSWIENKTQFIVGDPSDRSIHTVKSYRPLTEDEKIEHNASRMIYPFCPESVKINEQGNKALSFGLSSYGYDVRLDENFKIFTNLYGGVIDPKRLNPDTMIDVKAKPDEYGDMYVILPPHSYLLGSTIETFNIPKNVMVIAVGKSTYARTACHINVTPIEAGFRGKVVIEASNASSLPVKIYANEGIAQFLFFQGTEACQVSYADRNGKYQDQSGLTMAKV